MGEGGGWRHGGARQSKQRDAPPQWLVAATHRGKNSTTATPLLSVWGVWEGGKGK